MQYLAALIGVCVCPHAADKSAEHAVVAARDLALDRGVGPEGPICGATEPARNARASHRNIAIGKGVADQGRVLEFRAGADDARYVATRVARTIRGAVVAAESA